MAKTAKSSGTVTIAAAGAAPIIKGIVAAETPTITEQAAAQMEVAASTTVVIPFGNLTTATMIHLRFFDVSLGTARNATVLVNAPTATLSMPECTEFLMVGIDASKGPTECKVTTGSGNETRIEYEIAGT